VLPPRLLPPDSEIGVSESGGLTPPFRRVGWIHHTLVVGGTLRAQNDCYGYSATG